MATITKKNMYRDLMRLDGAKMRDLNPKSQLHYGASVVGPAVATGAKVAVIAAVPLAIAMCDNSTPQPDPTTCDCPDEATHLEVGAANVTCPADQCNHNGQCTEKVNAILNAGGVTVIKSPGVSTEEFNKVVNELNILMSPDALSSGQIANFKVNFPTVYIVKGSSISHETGSLTVGCDATAVEMYKYLRVDNSLVQAQTKNTFLADKGNKGREWVAKLMNERIASVNEFRNAAYDKANGISI